MNRFAFGLIVLSSLAVFPAPAQKKSKFPEVIRTAQFVMVMSQRELDFNQSPTYDDGRAVADVEEALHKWGRYKLVYRKEDADIILAVRRESSLRGRAGGIGLGTGQPKLTVEGAPSGDYLAVHTARPTISLSSLWGKAQRDGLAMPRLPLFKFFHDDVEEADLKTP